MTKAKIELNLENVIGPVLYNHTIPDKIGPMYVNDFIRFYIPIDFFKSSTETHPANMFGTNIYPINSPLPAVCVHQGVINKTGSKPEDIFLGARVLNIYDEDFNLVRTERIELKSANNNAIVGVDIIIQVTDSRSNFEGSRQYDLKTKSSVSLASNGVAFIFGQAVYSSQVAQPNNVYDSSFDMELLNILKTPEGKESLPFFDGRKWCRFGLTGEPVYSYDVLDFCDEGLPFQQWVSQRLRVSTLYFDTTTDRYEIAMMLNGDKIILKMAKLNQPILSLSQIRSDGTPIRQASKTIIQEQIEWENLSFSENGITVNEEYYGPVMCYFWAKRKRPLQ